MTLRQEHVRPVKENSCSWAEREETSKWAKRKDLQCYTTGDKSLDIWIMDRVGSENESMTISNMVKERRKKRMLIHLHL